MSATLFVKELDFQEFLDEPESFRSEHERKPAMDVTALRDDTELERKGISDQLYEDMSSQEAKKLGGQILRFASMLDNDDNRKAHYSNVGSWLTFWGKKGYTIKGIH